VQAPCIFGEGTGLFNQQGLVIPLITKYVVEHGYGFKLNDRANFDWVSVQSMNRDRSPLTQYTGSRRRFG
jgi:hypothetical protein